MKTTKFSQSSQLQLHLRKQKVVEAPELTGGLAQHYIHPYYYTEHGEVRGRER